MKALFNKKILYSILSDCKHFAAKDNSLPILMNVKIKLLENVFEFTATDMDNSIVISGNYDEDVATYQKSGTTTVNLKLLKQIVKNMSDETIQLEMKNAYTLTISDSNRVFELNTIDSGQYVALHDTFDSIYKDNITIKDMIKGIDSIECYVIERQFAPVLTGIYLYNKNDKLIFVGTDSFRLGEYKTEFHGKDEFKLIIPVKAARILSNILTKSVLFDEQYLTMSIGESQVSFLFKKENDLMCNIRIDIIKGNYPEYDREEIIPTQYNYEFKVNGKLFSKYIDSVRILTWHVNNAVDVALSNTDSGGLLELSSGKTDLGNASVKLPCESNDKDINFGINGKYIQDFIENGNESDLTVCLVNNIAPILIKGSDENLRYIIRPLINN